MIETFKPTKATIYYNQSKKTLAQVKSELKCDYIVNGGFFDRSDFRTLMWLVLDGIVISKDQYNDWGFVVKDHLPVMSTDKGGNFLTLVPILKDGNKLSRYLTPDVARADKRTAVGWTKDGEVILAVTEEAMTRETLQDYMLSHGAVDAMMCDGGGSAQGIFPNAAVTSSRLVPTMLAFWTAPKEAAPTPADAIVDMLRKEIGYLEKASNKDLDSKTANPGNNNYCKYSRDLDNVSYFNGKKQGYSWCAILYNWPFVQMYGKDLAHKMLYQPSTGSLAASCKYATEYYKKQNAFYAIPQVGDQAFFSWGHTGIVEKVENGVVYTIEGNTTPQSGGSTNGVWSKSYSLYDSRISGYGRPNWSLVENPKTESELAVEWITKNGIMLGDTDGDLHLDAALTRRQFAVMLYRYHSKYN